MEPTHAEVVQLLSNSRFTANDLPDWSSIAENQNTSHELLFGLMDESLSTVKYRVELIIQVSSITHKKIYKFTLYRVEFKSYTRIYQLEIRWFKNLKTIKSNKHFLPHEHIGRSPEGRIQGDESWLRWDFHQALEYFLKQTNITLDLMPDNPEVFVLKAQK